MNSMKKRINAVGIIEIFIGILTLLSTLISLISAIALDYNIISFFKNYYFDYSFAYGILRSILHVTKDILGVMFVVFGIFTLTQKRLVDEKIIIVISILRSLIFTYAIISDILANSLSLWFITWLSTLYVVIDMLCEVLCIVLLIIVISNIKNRRKSYENSSHGFNYLDRENNSEGGFSYIRDNNQGFSYLKNRKRGRKQLV